MNNQNPVWKELTRHYTMDQTKERNVYVQGDVVLVEETVTFTKPYTCNSILLLAKQVCIHFTIDPSCLRLIQWLYCNGTEYIYEYTFEVDDAGQFVDMDFTLVNHEYVTQLFLSQK